MGGNGISTTGLFRGTIYDIIGSNGSIGEVTVNATTANVTCGTVANKGSSGSEACSPLSLINATYEDYNLTMCYEPLGLGPFNALWCLHHRLMLLIHLQEMKKSGTNTKRLYTLSLCMTISQIRPTSPSYVISLPVVIY